MNECRSSAVRNLDFYMNDPKWLNILVESTVWTSIVQANRNKLVSQVMFADAGPGLGSFSLVSWVTALKTWTVSGSRWFLAVGLRQSLPLFQNRLSLVLCHPLRNVWLPSEITWPYQGAKEETSWEWEHGECEKWAGTQEPQIGSGTFGVISKLQMLKTLNVFSLS